MADHKILYLLRHGKAETGSAVQDDHDRELVARGREEGRAMGRYLTSHHIRPERVLCSTAARARETWEYVQQSYSGPMDVEYMDGLYLASANAMLQVLSEVPDHVASVLLVGHNPGLHQLALTLAERGKEEDLDRIALKFPTCALAGVALPRGWRDIRNRGGELALIATGKELLIGEDE